VSDTPPGYQPRCPTCGEQAADVVEHTRDGVVSADYLCPERHIWRTTWLAVVA
jgi:hypothetical protein